MDSRQIQFDALRLFHLALKFVSLTPLGTVNFSYANNLARSNAKEKLRSEIVSPKFSFIACIQGYTVSSFTSYSLGSFGLGSCTNSID